MVTLAELSVSSALRRFHSLLSPLFTNEKEKREAQRGFTNEGIEAQRGWSTCRRTDQHWSQDWIQNLDLQVHTKVSPHTCISDTSNCFHSQDMLRPFNSSCHYCVTSLDWPTSQSLFLRTSSTISFMMQSFLNSMVRLKACPLSFQTHCPFVNDGTLFCFMTVYFFGDLKKI